jgi:hypothetical protein
LIYHRYVSYYHISDRRSLSRTQSQQWLPESSLTSPTLLSPTILTTPLKSRLPHTSRTNGLSQCFSRHSVVSARRYCSLRRSSSISCTQTFAPLRKSPSGGSFFVCAPPQLSCWAHKLTITAGCIHLFFEGTKLYYNVWGR